MSSWQPWQVLSEHLPRLQVVRFSRSLEGKPMEWEALIFASQQEGLGHIFIKLLGRDDYFCITDTQGYLTQAGLSLPLDPWQVRMVCAEAFTSAKIARLFCLNEVGGLRTSSEATYMTVSVRANGQCLWNARPYLTPREPTPRRAPFRLFTDEKIDTARQVSDFMRRPALDIWAALQEALNDPTSDATFAYEWLFLTENERADLIWNGVPGTRKEQLANFQRMLLCALYRETRLWQRSDQWILGVSSATEIWLYSEKEEFCGDMPPSLLRDIETLWNHFVPLNSEILAHQCAAQWRRENIYTFHVEAHAPTAHEQLEAMLQWREWEKQHDERSG